MERSGGGVTTVLELHMTDGLGYVFCYCCHDARLTILPHLQEAMFLISQQKYLEYLEVGRITSALHVLRNELAPYSRIQAAASIVQVIPHASFL